MSGMPIIAVTSRFEDGNTFLNRDYSDSLLKAGGLPLAVPYLADAESVNRVCGIADGLLLSGGEDIDPQLYGEEPLPGLGTVSPERDSVERKLLEAFLTAGKPVFAICRGMQLLNAVAGGTLIQDIGSQWGQPLQHRQNAPRNHLSHAVAITPGTLLEKAVGPGRIRVNSFHHQAVKQPAPGFRVSAEAADGIIEGIESESRRFVLGVQWHPENLAAADLAASRLFAAFVSACTTDAGLG